MTRAFTVASIGLCSVVVLAVGPLAGCSAARDESNAVRSKAEEGIDKSSDAIEKAAEKTGDALARAGEKAGEALATAGEKSGEAVQSVGKLEKSKQALEKAAEKTGDAVVGAGEKTKEGLEKTGEGLQKAGSEITDAWILGRIKTGFIGKDVLKGSDINVDCDQHVVTLKGTVPSEAGRARAIEIAKNTEGVRRVVDQLTIGPKKE